MSLLVATGLSKAYGALDVFGGIDRAVPFREWDEPRAEGVYARTKWEGEREATRWSKHIVVRTCGLYGRLGKRTAGNFVETMLRLAEGAPGPSFARCGMGGAGGGDHRFRRRGRDPGLHRVASRVCAGVGCPHRSLQGEARGIQGAALVAGVE